MDRPKQIIVAGNGPSSQTEAVRDWNWTEAEHVFRCNYFFLPTDDALDYHVTDWFLCEEIADVRAAVAMIRYSAETPAIWFPGLDLDWIAAVESGDLQGVDIRVQRRFGRLPDACRWEHDLRPERPLMGSFALAVAVGLNPIELRICGHDLFKHPSKQTHGGMPHHTRDWQTDFNRDYLTNIHENHTLAGDVKYIRAALGSYRGHVICVGDVLAHYFKGDFPEWDWIPG